MQSADGAVPDRRSEVHGRLVDPPVGEARSAAARLCAEEPGIEADGTRKIVDGDVNMQALHDTAALTRLARAGLHAAAGAHVSGAPPQQFSVRKPSSSFMVSNRAA